MRAILAAARDTCRGRLHVVFGCGGDRDREKRPEMGAVAAELADAVKANMALALQHDRMRLLADCTGITGGHSVFDLYYLADAIVDSGLASKLREAVLVPANPAFAETVRFWETTCANRGIDVRTFDDRQQALDWLLTNGH